MRAARVDSQGSDAVRARAVRQPTAAHVAPVAMTHGRVAEERDRQYRAARAHEGALCRLRAASDQAEVVGGGNVVGARRRRQPRSGEGGR